MKSAEHLWDLVVNPNSKRSLQFNTDGPAAASCLALASDVESAGFRK